MAKEFTTYIIYSKGINRFYIGYTSLTLEERLSYHNYNNKGYTGRASDWEIVWNRRFETKKQAMLEEKKIKKRGAKRYLLDQE